jgi:hypothetical protein
MRFEEIGVEGPVDFLTMDVQGEEYNLVSGGIAFLDANVKVMHIGTHSSHIEAMLKAFLATRGWKLKYEFPLNTFHNTPHGGVLFDDGIQCWTNPRL